ncbi:MAG TPA: cytochrome c biogenesis protein ResB [Streptosporangiaceae bacterium]|jgi:cytochrome c biogenesis protein|nr:cytochrome c biogenesis protein ResB [Streptosporangiaceae bacterium]
MTTTASRSDTASSGNQTPPSGRVRFGLVGWLRWAWRQLTSMRTALVLLFLLAVASVPGSLLPQQGIDPSAVQHYYSAHPAIAPLLGRLSLFNVFAAPWFAAIYLLLFLSLAGCVVPRTFRLARSARAKPPAAPRHVGKLPQATSHQTPLAPAEALDRAAGLLASRRFRLLRGDGWVSAEKGYRREAGNLLFHLALLAILGSVALGGLLGYKANRLLVSGSSFANTVTSLDEFHPGRLVSAADLQPFTMTLNSYHASYVTSGALRGQPSSFDAYIHYSAYPGAPSHAYDLRVNHPLNVDGAKVYMIGHGYAPVFKVTDGSGRVVFDQPVPFIAVEQSGLTSEGVIKVPDARPYQLGFAGVFLPTAVDVQGQLASAFPAPLNPMVSLVAYKGNLGMNSGTPQSVYTLNPSGLTRLPLAQRPLRPGQSMKLPGGAGTLTFTGYRQWMSLAITYDPGQIPALIAGVAALAGLLLSFFVRRRRMFVRAHAGPDGQTILDVGGLARSDPGGGFEDEFAGLGEALRAAYQGSTTNLSTSNDTTGTASTVPKPSPGQTSTSVTVTTTQE